MREVAASLRERLKILKLLHRRNAGQFFTKVLGKSLVVVFGIQNAIYVIKNIFLGNRCSFS